MKKNLFSREECLKIINRAESENNWNHYTVGGSYRLCLFKPDIEISKKIIEYGKSHLNLNILDVNMGVIKYNNGDYINRHYDRHSDTDFNRDFLYNINVRLNNEYTGGQFYLKDELIEAEVGDVYHYKSSDWHEVKEITSGTRYVGLFYIRERDLGINKIM